MKKITLLAMALIMVFCAIACDSQTYSNNIPTNDIATKIDRKITNSDVFVLADEFYLSSYNSEYTPLISEYTIKYATSSMLLEEYGIFKVKDHADTEKIVKMIEEYRDLRVEGDMGYLPDELPKIKNAKTKVCGNYVMYAFLSESDTKAAFSAFEEALK